MPIKLSVDDDSRQDPTLVYGAAEGGPCLFEWYRRKGCFRSKYLIGR